MPLIKKYFFEILLQRIIVWRWNIFRILYGTWLEQHWLFTSHCYSYEYIQTGRKYFKE